MDLQKNNKAKSSLIAKNTLALYFRMFFTMLISLYTSRILLEILGVSDYGIYNVVGGVITSFMFLSSSMAAAAQRFFSFELSIGDNSKLKKLFSTTLNIHIIIVFTLLIILETVGLWFLNNRLNIPADRLVAANWVFQFSLLTFLVTVLSIPYNGLIISYEKMNVYAYVSILEVIMKLAVVFLLRFLTYDYLIAYSILIFCSVFLVKLTYVFYCLINFKASKYHFIWDKEMFTTLISYAGWNMYGNIASVARLQGVNILLNFFFNPVVNAAQAIAYQVNGAINSLASSFLTALNPPIVKSFADGDFVFMNKLIFLGSKFSFFSLLLVISPFILETDFILSVWLKEVPLSTVIFTKLILINLLIDSFSYTLQIATQATGKIKRYQLIISTIILLNLPFSYLFLNFYSQIPEVVFYVSISISLVAMIARLNLLSHLINFSVKSYLWDVVGPCLLISILVLIISYVISYNISISDFLHFLIVTITSLVSCLILIFLLGLNLIEKKYLINLVKNKLK